MGECGSVGRVGWDCFLGPVCYHVLCLRPFVAARRSQMIYFVFVASVLAVQNGAVLEMTGDAAKIEFGGALTLIHNNTEDQLTCSGKIQASDVLIEGTSTTVADLIGEVATLRQEMAAVKAFVGMMPPPASPPLLPPFYIGASEDLSQWPSSFNSRVVRSINVEEMAATTAGNIRKLHILFGGATCDFQLLILSKIDTTFTVVNSTSIALPITQPTKTAPLLGMWTSPLDRASMLGTTSPVTPMLDREAMLFNLHFLGRGCAQ